MNKKAIVLFAIISLILVGCQHGSGLSSKKLGAIAGGAAGAITGYFASDENKELYALGGAVAGAWLGGKIGQYLEEKDQQKMTETSQKAMITGEKHTWSNSENKVSGSAEVVDETTETAEVEVTVLKDRVQTVPPLDMIGEPYAVSSNLKVRGGPGTDYKVVDRLAKGMTVDIIGKVQGKQWLMTGSNQTGTGFVHMNYVQKVPVDQREASHAMAVAPAEKTEVQTVAAKRTCRTVKQIIITEDGSEREEEITACQGPNGWEPI